MAKSNHSIFSLKNPWDHNENSIWLASTLAFHRNIEKFNFPIKLTDEKKKQVISLVSKELLASPGLKKPIVVNAEEASPTEKDFFFEHFLTRSPFQQAHVGESFVVDSTGLFLATINWHDHLHLQLTDCTGEIENSWNQLTTIETNIGKAVNYSFSQKFGFLTTDPSESGIGFLVSIFLHLPAMIHTDALEEFLIKHKDESVTITGLQGKPRELIGDLVSIRNNYTLGVTEENVLSTLRSFTTKLHMQEKSLRSQLKNDPAATLKDKVSRAYAILVHSYQIDVIEAMNAISLLKLGVDLGWVEGVSIKSLNALFFNCRRAHLISQYDGDIAQEDLPHKRSAFVHQQLQGAVLKI
jgi:protein arginine kinase